MAASNSSEAMLRLEVDCQVAASTLPETVRVDVQVRSKRKHHLNEDQLRAVREYEAQAKREYRERHRANCTQLEISINDITNTDEEGKEQKKRRTIDNIVHHILAETNRYGREDKKEIIQGVLNDKQILPYVEDLLLPAAAIVRALRSALQDLKTPKTNDEIFVKRSAMTMLVNGLMQMEETPGRELTLNQVGKLLNIHPRNLYSALDRVPQSDALSNRLAFDLCKRKSSYGGLSHEVKDIVVRFWTEHTRVSPNKKDIIRKRLGRREYLEHPVHLLDESQTEYYLKFKDSHPQLQVRQRSFEKLKPWFVQKLKDRNTCCCVYHIQLMYFLKAFNIMRSEASLLHGSSCTCECNVCNSSMVLGKCTAAEHTFKGITKLWESCVCPKGENDMFHKFKCLMGQCKDCGIRKFCSCPHEQEEAALSVPVQVFENIQVQNKHAESKRKVLVVKQMPLGEFTENIKACIKTFIKHNFTYRWQADQYRECLKMFPSDTIVSVVDFAENYSLKEQNEIQSMHWHTNQCTILVHITYRRSDKDDSIVKEMHFYISDDKMHDTLFVQHCFLLCDKWLKEQGLKFKKHWVWSDGAASQFKGSRPFYFVGRFYKLTGTEMTWNFFGSGHGKGEHDGAGAVVKRALTHEQLKTDGVILRQAADVVDFLATTMANAASNSYAQSSKAGPNIKRKFWLVKIDDVDRSNAWGCDTVKGSRSLHSISGFCRHDPTQVKKRGLSCYCIACIKGHWRSCANKLYVQKWTHLTLKPVFELAMESYAEGCQDDDGMFEGSLDMLGEILCEGENFAVNAEATNEEGVEFYLLKCLKTRWLTDKAIKDQWNNICSRGTYVVTGYYYRQQAENPQHYTLLSNMGATNLYSHLVRAIKFEMPLVDSASQTYHLSLALHESIYNAMPYEAA